MPRRLMWLGLLATAWIVGVLALVILREPARQESARADFQAATLARSTDLYALHCAECHGAAGEGLSQHPPLDQEFVAAQDDALLFDTIARGRHGTDMAAFSRDWGGALTTPQIDGLVLLLQAGDWPTVAARVDALGLTPVEAAITAAGDLALPFGEQTLSIAADLYTEHCAECHGEGGIGTLDAPQLNSAYVRHRAPADLTAIVTDGVRYTEMEAFSDRLSADEIAALVTLLRTDFGASGTTLAAEPVEETPPDPELLAAGQAIFETWCAICHGVYGEGGSIAPSLNDLPTLSPDYMASRVRSGINAMPPFTEADLPDEQLTAVIAYARANIIGSGLPVFTPEEIAAGGEMYVAQCAECHGAYGEGNANGPPLATSPPTQASELINFTRVGSANTPPIPAAQLSDADLDRVIAYLYSLGGP